MELEVTALEPSIDYIVKIWAYTSVGEGSLFTVTVMTGISGLYHILYFLNTLGLHIISSCVQGMIWLHSVTSVLIQWCLLSIQRLTVRIIGNNRTINNMGISILEVVRIIWNICWFCFYLKVLQNLLFYNLAPYKPTNVKAVGKTQSVLVTWTKPDKRTGKTSYIVEAFDFLDSSYVAGRNCSTPSKTYLL